MSFSISRGERCISPFARPGIALQQAGQKAKLLMNRAADLLEFGAREAQDDPFLQRASRNNEIGGARDGKVLDNGESFCGEWSEIFSKDHQRGETIEAAGAEAV